MSEKDLKLTDLDYATGDHHLQMMKAALPYLDIRRQRSLSMFIRAREMMHTMEFFRENDDGRMFPGVPEPIRRRYAECSPPICK